MRPYARIATPYTVAEIQERDRLITAWEALTDILFDHGLLASEFEGGYEVLHPTEHVKYVDAEGPERKPEPPNPFKFGYARAPHS
jgi:hypothetical protein